MTFGNTQIRLTKLCTQNSFCLHTLDNFIGNLTQLLIGFILIFLSIHSQFTKEFTLCHLLSSTWGSSRLNTRSFLVFLSLLPHGLSISRLRLFISTSMALKFMSPDLVLIFLISYLPQNLQHHQHPFWKLVIIKLKS